METIKPILPLDLSRLTAAWRDEYLIPSSPFPPFVAKLQSAPRGSKILSVSLASKNISPELKAVVDIINTSKEAHIEPFWEKIALGIKMTVTLESDKLVFQKL